MRLSQTRTGVIGTNSDPAGALGVTVRLPDAAEGPRAFTARSLTANGTPLSRFAIVAGDCVTPGLKACPGTAVKGVLVAGRRQAAGVSLGEGDPRYAVSRSDPESTGAAGSDSTVIATTFEAAPAPFALTARRTTWWSCRWQAP